MTSTIRTCSTFAALVFGMTALGTTNVSPNLALKRIAMSRVISTCWRWSSPTGTSIGS